MALNNATTKWNMSIPFWGVVVAFATAAASYYGQKEANSVALTEIRGGMRLMTSELNTLKESVVRMESSRYTATDASRDFAWRDERAVELAKRVVSLEAEANRKH